MAEAIGKRKRQSLTTTSNRSWASFAAKIWRVSRETAFSRSRPDFLRRRPATLLMARFAFHRTIEKKSYALSWPLFWKRGPAQCVRLFLDRAVEGESRKSRTH